MKVNSLYIYLTLFSTYDYQGLEVVYLLTCKKKLKLIIIIDLIFIDYYYYYY